MNAEGEELRNEMAALRRSLGQDLEHAVTGLREMADWRELVRRHPWACLGAAALAGFAIVPSKATVVLTADAESMLQLSRGSGVRLPAAAQGPSAVSSVGRMVGGMLLRAATTYVTQRISAALSGAQNRAAVEEELR